MFWSTEDHHRQQQHNYYNLQSVQHQNGLQQATAAVSPHQQQHVIQPPSIQQQPQQQPQQHRPAQQIHQTHFANQQQFQQQQQQQQHHQRWAQRPGPILTIPPFLQQYPNNVSNSTQFCAPPQNYYQSTQQYPQASAVSAAPQQRQCLPQGCTVYTMPPPASALRQNITQPPPNIMTPTTSATPQQMQMQYFSTQQFCQPPPLGQQTYAHVLTPTLPETQIVKPRKHAIPIIDPITYENIMERKSRSNESPNTDDASSIRTTPSSTSIDESKETENDVKKEDQAKDELPQQENKIEEEMTSASSPGVLDHVESIAPEDEAVEEEVEVEIVESKIPSEEMYKQINQELSCSSFSSTIPIIEDDKQAEKINRGDNDEAISHIEGNLAHSVIESEEMLSSIDPKEKSLSIHPEEKPLSNETTEKPESSPKAVVANTKAGKQSKKQQTQQSPPTTKPTNKKAKRNSKRLKESQKKQKADLIKSENNNTNKATNQNENNKAKQTDKLSDPSNLTNRLKTKAKELSRSNSSTITEEITTPPDEFEGESSIAVSPTTTSLDTYEKSEENSLQVDDSAETLTYDENDHSSSLQLNDNPRLSKSVEIASKILEIEPTDDNSLLFLNSSVSGYEEDISPSPTYFSREEDDKVEDILFGDFSQTEYFQQEISSEEISNKETTLLKDLDQKYEEDNHASLINDEFKEKKYTLQELKSLAAEPASKIPPSFRGQICQIIGKNPRDGPSVPHQHNQIYQPMSYKESINFNRKRNRKLTDSPHQQFQQQQILDNNQQQQQQRNNPDIIRVYLSLNEDIQLAESKNAWVPPILKDFGPKAAEDDEQILKKIRGILNKLTPENFDKLLQTASIFPMNTVERINKVMLLIFEKTISEPNFAPTYARFCKFLFNPEDSNHTMFKYNLIKRIQDEFEANVNNAEAKAAKLKPLMEKLTAVNNSKEKQEIKAELDDQEYQFRRRAWGTVRFIAEMCKIGFIRIDTVCNCVEGLLDVRCEEKLEYMCKLLTTVGHQLEIAGRKPKNSNGYDIKQRLDKIFDKIRQVVEKKNGAGQKISSRVRFMMQDIIELRARSWDHKDTTTVVPSREASPAMKRDPPSSQQHRGTRNFLPSMAGGYDKKRQHGNEAQQKTTSIDRNKLSFNLSISNSADIKLGNSSPLMWQVAKRSQQQQTAQITLPTTPPEQQDLSNDECERLITALIEIVSEGEPSELFAKWITIDKHHHECIVNHVLNEQLYSEKGKRRELVHYPQLFTSLMKEKLISKQTFIEAYLKFNEIIEDAVQMDVPLGWDNLFKLIGPLLHFELVPFDAIWNQKWFNKECGNKFVISLIKYFTSQFGAYYMRYFWDNNSLQWTNFLSEDKIQSFINGNRFRFIDDSTNCAPPLFIQRSAEELVQRIKELLAQCDQNIDVIIDFINTNVVIDCNFVRSLTMFLCDYTVIYIPNQTSSNNTNKIKSSDSSTASTSSSFKLQRDKFIKKCIPLLRLCLDSSDERELSCLHAIVASGNRLGCHKFPIDLISSILVELYGEVISKESFEKWREELSSLEGDISKELDAFFKTLPI